jgi:hypothetical protein
MANKAPFFLTGGNAVIKVNGFTVAFATDVAFSTKIRQQSPRVLSKYEVETHVPLAYDVAGQFSLIRYARGLASAFIGQQPDKVSNDGNGLGSMGITTLGGTLTSAIPLNGLISFFKTGDQDAPFDLEVQQKHTTGSDTADITPIFRLKGCRIESVDIKISKKSAAIQTVVFKAIYFDDDTLIASNGVGGNKELKWQ